MDDLLKWAEQAGAENMKFRAQNADQLTKDANTIVTLLLAGLGGAMAIGAKALEGPTHAPLAVLAGVAALAIWFMVLAGLTLHYCISTSDFPAPTNEPKNLFQPDFALDVLRKIELENLQVRIEQITKRNAGVAARLDRIRYACAASPIIFIVVVAASAHWPDLFFLASAAG